MKKTFKKALSVLLAVVMCLSIVPLTQLMPTANAADLYASDIDAKISLLKNTFRHGEYFAGNAFKTENLKESSLKKICSCKSFCYECSCNCGQFYLNNNWISGQCKGFAYYMGNLIFGGNPNLWNKVYDSEQVYPGDIITGDNLKGIMSGSYPHAIFVIAVDGDTVYYGDSNASGPCQINWKKSTTRKDIQTSLTNGATILHAKNNKYNDHKCSYGSNYLCKTCGAVNPSKITSMSDTTYIVVTDNAKTRKGPYETCDKVYDITNSTILTVNGKITNTKNNLWYRLTDGSWIYSEHVKKYSITYTDIADGCYRLKNVATGKYLIVDSGNGANGRNVSVWSLVESNTEQKWKILEDSLGFKIHTELSSGRVLNSYGTTVKAGNNVNIWDLIANDATQRWKFQKVSGGYVIRNVSVPSCVVSVGNGDDNVSVQTFASGDKKQIWVIEAVTGCSHSYDNGVLTTLPSCTSGGVRTYSCTKCGSSYTSTVSALGHSYDSGTVTKSATCTSKGTKTYTCVKCDATKTEAIAEKGHSYDSGKVTKAATCTSTGVKTYTCTRCNGTKTETIAQTGHKSENISAKAATCTESGYTSGTKCSVCNTLLSGKTAVAALGHNYKSTHAAATCTDNERTVYTCSRCNDTYSEDIKGKSSWSSEQPPSGAKNIETKTQYKSREKLYQSGTVKNVDGWTLYQTDENVSSWSAWQNSPASASVLNSYGKYDEQTRYVEGESKTVYVYFHYCNSRGTYWANFVYEAATKYHETTFDSPLTNKVGNSVGTGSYYTSSTACPNGCTKWYIGTDYKGSNATRTETTPGYTQWRYRTYSYTYHHYCWGDWSDWSDAYVGASANVEVDTRKMYRYDLEGDKATGHSYDNGRIEREPGCTSIGIKIYTCSKCGGTKVEKLTAKGHKSVNISAKNATCTENGYTAGTKCSVCNKTLSGINTVAPTGHRMVTDNHSGDEYCTVCGYRIKGEEPTTEEPTTNKPEFIPPNIDAGIALGDIDDDGKITAADARLALRTSVKLEKLDERKTYAADVDKNSSVTAADARLILRYSVGLEKW